MQPLEELLGRLPEIFLDVDSVSIEEYEELKVLLKSAKAEYRALAKDAALLAALEEFGVDNWDGYSDAARAARQRERESHESTTP